MRRSRRRQISQRSRSASRTSSIRAWRQRTAQSQTARSRGVAWPRGAAPKLKNILAQLTGLASASPWRKQRDKRGSRKPKALRIEGLERREMLTVQGDIHLAYAESKFGSRIGPALYENMIATSAPFPLFEAGRTFIGDGGLPNDFNLHYSVESDMEHGVDYLLYAYAIVDTPEVITVPNGVVETHGNSGATNFDIKFLRDLEANEEHYVRVTLLDTGDYDVPNSAGYNAPLSYSSELTNFETWYNLETRTAYFRGASPSITDVAPVVDCDCGCLCAGETKADVKEENGAATVKHKLSGLDAAADDPSATPNGVLSYNSAALTSPTLRGYDFLAGVHSANGHTYFGPPDSVEVTASYYQLNGSNVYVPVSGTSTTSFFTTDYDGAQFGTNSAVQYALTPNASSLTTGVYQWRMSVKYHWADGGMEERAGDIEGYQLILNDSTSVFGKGWQFSEAPNLTVQDSGTKIVMRSGQNAHTFFYDSNNPNNEYDNGVGVSGLAKLAGTTGSGFDYTDQYGTKWTYFGNNGRLFKSVDRNDNKTEYHYAGGGTGQLEYILYPNGRRTIFEYEGGYVSRIIQNALENGTGGTSTWLDIDSSGRLQSITGEDPDGDTTGLPKPFTHFTYEGSSTLVHEVWRDIVSPLTPSTTTYEKTTYTYHAPSGTVASVMHHSGADCNCGASSMNLDAAQRWGAADPTLGGSDPQGSATNPAPLRAIGAPQGTKSEQVSSTEWRNSTFTIDGFNQISSQTVSPGTASEATTLYQRNADGLIRRMIEADPDGAGPLSSPITTYNYDTSGNLTSIGLPNSQSQAWTYGTHNQVTSYTDELGRETRYQLDSRGNVERMQQVQVIGTPNTFELQGDDVFTQYFYTDAPTSQPPGARLPGGLITKVIDPLNHETKYQYYRNTDSVSAPGAGTVDDDLLGLLEKVTFAVSTTDQAEVLFGYDSHRRLTSQTDELTRTTAYAYDAQNRVISITEPDSDLTDSLEAPVTTFSYDTLGRLARQVDPDPDGAADPRDAHWTEYHYSNNDRTLTVVESPREDNASEIETKYEHDMLGRLLKVTDPLDDVTEYTYTDLDQIATVKLPEASSGAPRPVYSYEYDALGRLKTSLAPAPPVNTQPAVGAAIGTSNTLSVTTAAATLELPIFNLQNGATDLFTDAEDAASTLRYEIVANDNAALFDSIRIENFTPGGLNGDSYRKVVFDFAGSTAGSANITIRATDRGGRYRDRSFTVSRTALGSPQLVNTTTSGTQTNAVVANLADGRYVVVWEGAGATDSDGVFFKVFKADGTVDVAETRINSTTTGHQGSPSVAAFGNSFAIVWSDHSQSTSRVLFRFVSANGIPVNTIKTVYTNSDNADTTPVIAMPDTSYSSSGFAVAWRGTQSDGSFGIYTARVTYTTSGTIAPTQVNTTPTGNQQRPTIAAIEGGGYIIAWDGQGADDAAGIFARRYRFDDAPYTEVRLNVDPSDVFNHSYAVTSDGGFVVTWMVNSGSGYGILARQFAPDGNPTGAQISVANATAAIPPHVARYDNGDFVVTYRDSSELQGVRFRQDGTQIQTGNFTIASAATGVARAAARADGSALVVYDGSNGTDSDGVFVTQVAAPDTSPSAGGAFRVLGIEPGSGTSGGATAGRVDQVLVNFSDAVDDDTLTTDDIISFHHWDGATETTISITGILPISRTQIALRFGEQTAAGEYRLVLGSNITRSTGAAVKLDQNRNGTADEAGDKFSASFYLAAAAPTTAAETNYEYDALGRTTKTIDSAGAVTEYAYSQTGQDRLITVSERLSAAGAVYRQTVYRYDALDRLIRVTLPDTDDTIEAPEIDYAYDKASNLLRVTDPRSAKTDYRYDARNRLIRRFDAHAISGNATNTDLSSLPSNPDSETIYGGITEYTYNDASELVSVLDTRSGLTQYAYDRLGRLKTLTQPDPDGSESNQPLPAPVTHFKYDNVGYLIQRTDPEFVARDGTISPVTDFEYDTQGNLRFVREAKPRSTSDRPVWEYQYDDAGQLLREIDPLAATTDYEYDGLGQLVTITEPDPVDWAGNYGAVTQFRYDIRGNLVTQFDTLGAPTQFAYDADGRLTARTNALGGTSGTQFDSLGRVTADIDELGRVTRYTYTQLDQLATLREADPDGPASSGIGALSEPVTSYHYDAAGNLTSVVDPRSHTTTYDYDALGRLIEITQPADSHSHQPVWQYQYNAAGDLTGAIDPEGRVTGFDVDALGRRIRMIAPDPTTLGGSGGPVTEYAYDSSGRLTTVKMPDADGAAGNYHAATTTYLYDNLGRLARQTLPNKSTGAATGGAVTNYTRDLLGRLEIAQTSVAAGQTLTSTYAYDRLGRLSDISEPGQAARQFWYDALGRVEWSGEDSQWSSYDYDSLGQEVRRQDPRLATTTQTFDAAGQLTSVTDPARNTTRWEYDRLGRVTRETDPKQHDRTYGYDVAGNLTSQTDRLGQTRTFDYDNLNRLTAEKWLNSSAAVTRTLSWDYDRSGLLVNTDDRLASGSVLASAEYHYHYDAAGRLDKSLSTIAGLSKEIQQTHTRDPLGRRTGLAVDLVTGFDSSDWSVDTTVAEHANAYTFDHLGQLTRVTQSGGVSGDAGVAAKRVDLEYDNAGRTTKIKRRDGLTDGATIVAETTNTYGTSFLSASLLKIETTNSSSQVIARETYQYLDPFFRVSTHKTGVGAAEHTTTYQYDTTGQLISADDSATTGVDEDYVWDLNGNRKNKKDKVNTGNQLTADENGQYVYDEEGNLEEARSLGSNSVLLTAYSYDHRQRLVLVTIKDPTGTTTTKTVEYKYDSFDRRVSSTVTNYVSGVAQTPVTEYYVYDEGAQSRGDVLLDFVDSDGPSGNAAAVSKRYLWGQAVDQLFAQEDVAGKALADSDRYAWLLQDKLGSVRDVLDRSGALIARVEYNAFGVIESVTNAAGQTIALPTRWLYTCQEYDPTTGNIWFSNGAGRGRWYSPTQNRFLQPDELGFAAGDRNLYRYVGNSPTNYTDPSGREIYDVPGATSNFLPGTGNLAGITPPGGADLSHINPTDKEIEDFDSHAYEIPREPPTVVKVTEIRSMWDNYDQSVALGDTDPCLWTRIGVGFGKTLIPRSDPSYLVEYSDGTKTLFMGSPSTGDLLNQALALLSFAGTAATAKNLGEAMIRVGKDLVEEVIQTGIQEGTGIPIFRVRPKGGDTPDTARKINPAPDAARVGDCYQNLTPEQIAKFPGCFVAGTLISTAHGLRPIESIEAGDQVWAFDFAQGKWRLRPVLETYQVEHVDDLIEITVDGRSVESTYHHPYWVITGDELRVRPRAEHIPDDPVGSTLRGRWVDAGDLQVGDVVLLRPDQRATVTSVDSRPYNGIVHNFQVDDLHCYAVGPGQVLVHNNSKAEPPKQDKSGSEASKPRYSRDMEARRQALLRDADDPNSGLTQQQRDFIKEHDGRRVPPGLEVSHETPLYTVPPDQRKKLDVPEQMKTQPKPEHRNRHKVGGDQYEEFGPPSDYSWNR